MPKDFDFGTLVDMYHEDVGKKMPKKTSIKLLPIGSMGLVYLPTFG